MNLSKPFIERPVMTLLVMATFLFFGFFSYKSLPVSDLPNVDFPTIQVSVNYPGANPATMANSIATPLEQQFMTIEGLQSLFSTSNSGTTNVVLQFALERDIDNASTDVQTALTRAQPNLPSDLPNNPIYEKVNPALTPILYLSFTSDAMSISDLYDYANTTIGQRLSMVEGVSQVLAYGSPFAVRVQVDPEKLAAKQIGIDQVTAVLREGNVNLPLGTLYGKRDDFTVGANGQIFRAAGFGELVLKNANGELLKIKDIGQALDSVQNDKLAHRYITKESDRECIVLAVLKQTGHNSVRVIKGVRNTLDRLKSQLPASLEIQTIYDQSNWITESVRDVEWTLGIAIILVVLIVYLSLGSVLNAMIPSLALPISIFGTFAVMFLLHFSIDIFSMLALTLSVGFLIDDAIVVLENSARRIGLGETPLEASLRGSQEISTTILSMTLCLVAAFIPMLFMGGVIGRIFQEFAVTIISAVLISGFVSLSLTPMLSSRLMKAETKKWEMVRFYKPLLHWAMNHRVCMLIVGSASILASLWLVFALPKDFLPPEDIGFIQAYTLARDGTSPFLMAEYHKEACERIRQDKNVDSMFSVSSYSNGNEGVIFIKLKPFKERQVLTQCIEKLDAQLKGISGLNCFLSPLPLIDFQVGTTAQALYQYALTGLDRSKLYEYAPKLALQMKNDPHFAQVSSDLRTTQPQWQLSIDRDRASNYNLSAADIETYLTYAYSNNKIALINAPINQYDVLIETLPKFYKDPTVLSKLYVRSTTGYLVPLSEVVTVQETVGPLTINHINGQAAVGLSFNVAEGKTLGEALKQIRFFTEEKLPQGIQGQVIGTADVFESSFANLQLLLLLALFVIYVILGILYESFIHPLTVMSALPPALLGGLFTLFVFQQTLSVYSLVGLILLVGIVLKNGILMVDFANSAVKLENKSAREAIVEACLIRFRPILMTTSAALMGALPIALGVGGALNQTRISLGLCVVGGLLVSQLLTLLLTPVVYSYFEELRSRVKLSKSGL